MSEKFEVGEPQVRKLQVRRKLTVELEKLEVEITESSEEKTLCQRKTRCWRNSKLSVRGQKIPSEKTPSKRKIQRGEIRSEKLEVAESPGNSMVRRNSVLENHDVRNSRSQNLQVRNSNSEEDSVLEKLNVREFSGGETQGNSRLQNL